MSVHDNIIRDGKLGFLLVKRAEMVATPPPEINAVGRQLDKLFVVYVGRRMSRHYLTGDLVNRLVAATKQDLLTSDVFDVAISFLFRDEPRFGK